MEGHGRLTGFSAELWNEVAAQLQVTTSYRQLPSLEALFGVLRSGEADIAITGLIYTQERDKDFDFTLPILSGGLQVLVPTKGSSVPSAPLVAFLSVLFSRATLYWLFAWMVLVLVPAHIFWFLDRSDEGVPGTEKYFPGVFNALLWASEGLLSQVPMMPRRKHAHVLGVLWLFAGVIFVAFFTAQLTATLTVEQIRGAINGPGDLPGKRVGAVAGSTAVPYLRNVRAEVVEFATPDELYAALERGDVAAAVNAAPVLRYYAAHEGAGKVRLVGSEFNKEDAGFIVRTNSPLRKRVDSALIAVHENGTYQRLYEKWFGKD